MSTKVTDSLIVWGVLAVLATENCTPVAKSFFVSTLRKRDIFRDYSEPYTIAVLNEIGKGPYRAFNEKEIFLRPRYVYLKWLELAREVKGSEREIKARSFIEEATGGYIAPDVESSEKIF